MTRISSRHLYQDLLKRKHIFHKSNTACFYVVVALRSSRISFLRVLMRLNRIQNEIQITSSLKSFYLHPSGFTLCMFTTSFCDKKSLSPFILLGERQAVMYKLSLTSFQDILFSCRNLRNFFKVCFLKTMFFLEKNPPYIFHWICRYFQTSG